MSYAGEITFDIVVSGCATDCWHCYISGGPASLMAIRDYENVLVFVDEFCRIAKGQNIKVYPYLDLEPMLHPEIEKILSLARTIDGFSIPACIPTTGLPITTRNDWEQVLTAYHDAGVRQLEFTLHGPEAIHDKAVSRKGAFQCLNEAVQRAKRYSFEISLNLMVSKPMLKQFQETMYVVERNEYNHKRAQIPSYAPNEKLRGFEQYRPELADVIPYREFFQEFCDNKVRDAEYWNNVEESTEEKAYQELLSNKGKYESYQLIIDSLPTWYFLTVGPGLDIWYGNGFHRTQKLGQIGKSTPMEVLEKVLDRYPNYSFGGYFPIDRVPSPIEVGKKAADPTGKRIYHEIDEIHVKWLDKYLMESSDSVSQDAKIPL